MLPITGVLVFEAVLLGDGSLAAPGVNLLGTSVVGVLTACGSYRGVIVAAGRPRVPLDVRAVAAPAVPGGESDRIALYPGHFRSRGERAATAVASGPPS
ncbi:hypothetical protein Dac01nite_00810 [Demequina activiva]|uniref:Uncharacterized protein n=1 Tax=Demequina activiva TaxID=1582364 RepID=A0A919PZP0_9MICO|nr:hypothetical protein Dac01nite_00810 [Demequina activiva]